jgi:modification methylase
VQADARDLPGALPWHLVALAGTAALVLTSPPYGPAAHAHARAASTQRTGQAGVTHRRDTYADPADAANLANAPTAWALMDGFTQILHAAAWLLHPSGRLVITVRPWRQNGELIDLPSMIIDAAEHAGFIHTDRCVALLTGLRHGRLLPRPSFLQLLQLRRTQTAGARLQLIAHEDVLVFEAPTAPSWALALPAEPVVGALTSRRCPPSAYSR